ncbi:reverse transcriptase domain-containing protein [Tanacetum coccineum]
MVNNIPLVLNVWEPGIWLDKVEPSTIPVWACVYSLPMELCNGNGIGKVFSGIGKPMLMDKLTKERCLKKARKLDFDRVLVEVFASDDLPDFLEIEAEGEIAAKAIKDAMKSGDSVSIKSNDGKCDDDGFVTVGRKGKANITQSNDKRFVMKNRNFCGNFRHNFGRQGPNQQNRFSNQKYQAVGVKYKSGGENIKSGSKGFDGGKSFGENEKGRVSYSLGSSKISGLEKGDVNENIHVSNSFQAFDDQDMVDKEEALNDIVNEEYDKILDYFFKNYSNYGMEPYIDEEEVKSKNERMMDVIKPEKLDENGHGLNNDLSQKQVMDLLRGGNFSFCRLLETKVKKKKLMKVYSKVLGTWEWLSNAAACEGGTGIIIGWNSFVVKVIGRKELWRDLCKHSVAVKDFPWVLMGDFNIILDPSKRSFGSSSITAVLGILRFLLFVVSDHAPVILNIPGVLGVKPKPFKFANFLASKDEFLPSVRSVRNKKVPGVSMFSVVSMLKMLKKPFRKMKYAQGDLSANTLKFKEELCSIQSDMVRDPSNVLLRSKEISALNAYKDAAKDEELFLKQRSKFTWLSEGDFNTKYFYNVMKEMRNRSRIDNVEDGDGNFFSGTDVGDQFVKHFEKVLGRKVEVNPIIEPDHLFANKLSQAKADCMVRPISDEEIKVVSFGIADDKAPGPDDFSSKFFKSAWSIMGTEFTKAIKYFFYNGRLLKEINDTVLALVPKVKTPKKVSDFRLISCCTVLYKCISKVIANRIKDVINSIVNSFPSAFIPSRQISDNIMLTQELMRNYHRMSGPSKVAFKININKANDTVDWGFLR